MLDLIVDIKDEKYDYSRNSYLSLLSSVREVYPTVNQILIDVNDKLAYCYATNVPLLIA